MISCMLKRIYIVLILDFLVHCRVFCQNQTCFPVFRLTPLLEGQQSRTEYDEEEEKSGKWRRERYCNFDAQQRAVTFSADVPFMEDFHNIWVKTPFMEPSMSGNCRVMVMKILSTCM